MKKIVLFSLILLTLSAGAQDFRKDLLAVSRNMSQLKKYAVTMKYSMFVDGKFDKPYSSKTVNISMDKDRYNMVEEKAMEIIEDKDESMVIDHLRKTVIINTMRQDVQVTSAAKEDAEYDEMMDLFENNFDSLMSSTEKITVLSYAYPYKTYEVIYDRYDEYSKAIYVVDLKNKVLKSMTAFYAQPEYVQGLEGEHIIKMHVEYENFRINQEIPASVFSMNKYVDKLSQKKYVLKGSVKNYKLQII